MDGGVKPPSSPSKKICLAEVFDKLCPMYMAMGMTYEQYWHGDPVMVKYFREADRLKRQRMSDDAWLQGYYVYEAVASLIPALNPMTKRGVKVKPYREKPIDLYEQSRKDAAQRAAKRRQDNMKERFKAMTAMWNAQFEGKVVNADGSTGKQ